MYYQSWAGIATASGKLSDAQLAQVRAQGPIVGGKGDPHDVGKLPLELLPTSVLEQSKTNGKLSDGAVGIDSARWGNYRGEIPADHLDLVDSKAGGDQKRTGFDDGQFYKGIAEDLAKRGD